MKMRGLLPAAWGTAGAFGRRLSLTAAATLLPEMALAATEEGKAALPQMDVTSYPGQVFWLILTFVVLLLVMWRLALPRVTATLDKRERKLTGDLEQAENLRRDAHALEEKVRETLAKAQQEAQEILRAAAEQIAAERAQKLAVFEEEAARMAAEAEKRIGNARQKALTEIREAATETAGAIVEKFSGSPVNVQEAAAAVDAAAKNA